jgi:indole-3-acetate monooxygenase
MDTIIDEAAPRLPADIDAEPVVQAAAAIRPKLRQYQEQMEREQRFPAALVEQLRGAGFYRMLIPRALGGLEVDPLTYLRVGELLAQGLGSVGWNIANNGIAGLVSLGLPEEGVEEIHGGGSPSIIAGTAVQGGGQAVRVEGGFRVKGHWPFGTGCQESSWMLGSFQVLDDHGKPRKNPDGSTLYRRGIFHRAEAEIVPGSWDVSGMRGTGSFDWEVNDVFLPDRRTVIHAGLQLDNEWSRWPGLTYQLPGNAWIGPHHSAVICGIARAGIDAFIELAREKTPRGRTQMLCDNVQVQEAVGRADALLDAGRAGRNAMISELWNTVAAGRQTTIEQRARCRLASTNAAESARQAMDLVYRFGGSTSFRRGSRLAEAWRDLQVVGQTVTLSPEWYPIAGRALLGMQPGPRLR